MTDPWKRNETAQQAPRTVEQFRPLIIKMARRFMARAVAIRSPYGQEDYEQELVATLLRCNASYTPDGGASFMNFFIQAGWRNIQRMHRIDLINCGEGANVRIEDMRGEDGDMNLTESIPDTTSSTLEENILGEECLRFIIANVSDDTAHMLEFLLECPDFLMDQFDAYHAGMNRILDEGINAKRYKGFDLGFVCRLTGMSAKESKVVLREVAGAIDKWNAIGEGV